jgi:hypothetical protein
MEKLLKIGLIEGGFQHAFSSTLWKKPTFFKFTKNKIQDITFFIDNGIINNMHSKECKIKIGWVLESRDITGKIVNIIKQNLDLINKNYDYIITHNKDLYDLGGKFLYYPPHGYWIENPQIYEKTKLVSMMSSSKGWTEGHRNRLKYVEKFKNKVDLFGRGFKDIDKKEESLKDYMFSITIENDKYETYWSEKILDCFACGTIPIYYGSPDINKFFDINGIIILDDKFKIENLSKDLYFSKMNSIKKNFELSLKYDIIEDILYNEILKNKI